MNVENFEASSIIEVLDTKRPMLCSYCQSGRTAYNRGMWAHSLAVKDYQNLIDRGWQRSGHYIYMGNMPKTCCPTYPTRCDVGQFFVSKSQKKVLRRFHNYLKNGEAPRNVASNESRCGNINEGQSTLVNQDACAPSLPKEHLEPMVVDDGTKSPGEAGQSTLVNLNTCAPSLPKEHPEPMVVDDGTKSPGEAGQSTLVNLNTCAPSLPKEHPEPMVVDDGTKSPGEAGAGGDGKKAPSHRIVRKAKAIRQENKYKKLISQGLIKVEAMKRVYFSKKTNPEVKEVSIEDYFPSNEEMAEFVHKLEGKVYLNFIKVYLALKMKSELPFETSAKMEDITQMVKLVPVGEVLGDSEILDESFDLYHKYQSIIHNEEESKCTLFRFKKFLLASPLPLTHTSTSPPCGLGSFHHQYWLDGKLKAVGVIDILTEGVCSVYFFYDPDLRSLSFGTYGVLNEICFVRSLTALCASIKYYYLGYYIQNCRKLKYKIDYNPLCLLCPETYTWHRIEKCLPKIEAHEYSRLEEDPTVIDEDGAVCLPEVMVYHKKTQYSYAEYKKKNLHVPDEELMKDCVKHMGQKCCQSIQFYVP